MRRRRHDRDVVEVVRRTRALGTADLDLGHGCLGSGAGGRARRVPRSAAVVGGLDGHLDVVRVALLEARRGDPDELALGLELGDGARPDVEHRLAQSADELVRDGRQRAAVGHPALDALGHDLVVAPTSAWK